MKVKSQRSKVKIFIIAIILLAATPMFAIEAKFEASLNKRVIAIGESAQMGLTFYGTQDVPAPDIGQIDGLEIRYMGPSTMMTVLNGRISTSVTHMYRVLPLRTGKFQLGPFTFDHKGTTYVSNVVMLEVAEERSAVQQATSIMDEPIDASIELKDRIFLTLHADKISAYVNELIPVTVKLFVSRLNVSDIQLPIFAQEGFSKVEFKEPKQGREMVDGIVYDTLEFKTSIFGTKPGDYRLGPAKVKCNMILRKRTKSRSASDFWGDEFNDPFFDEFMTKTERRPMELVSDSVPLIISQLPKEARPADFMGAVGDYQFIYSVNPKKVKAGDPVTLTMEINGTGNFNTVIMPRLGSMDGFKAYEPQVKTEAQRKVFTQILIPESEKVTQAPVATFTYFDPKKKAYKTITQGPVPITVEKGAEEAPAQVVGPSPMVSVATPTEEPQRSLIHIKDSLGRTRRAGYKFYENAVFVSLLPLPLVVFVVFASIRARENRLKSDSRYYGRVMSMRVARKGLRAVRETARKGEAAVLYEAIFKALQEYLGYRLGIPVAGVTFNALESVLREKAIDDGVVTMIKNLFDMCDEARFGRSSAFDDFRMKNDAKSLERIIRYFERVRL